MALDACGAYQGGGGNMRTFIKSCLNCSNKVGLYKAVRLT